MGTWEDLLEKHGITELLGQGGVKLIMEFLGEEDQVDAGPDSMHDEGYKEKRRPDATRDEETARKLLRAMHRRITALRVIEAVCCDGEEDNGRIDTLTQDCGE